MTFYSLFLKRSFFGPTESVQIWEQSAARFARAPELQIRTASARRHLPAARRTRAAQLPWKPGAMWQRCSSDCDGVAVDADSRGRGCCFFGRGGRGGRVHIDTAQMCSSVSSEMRRALFNRCASKKTDARHSARDNERLSRWRPYVTHAISRASF